MIDCHIIKDLIPGYADDVLGPKTKSDVDAHIESCSECREVLEQVTKPIESKVIEKNKKEKINFLKKVNKRTWIKVGATAAGLIIVAALLLQFFVMGSLAKSSDISFEIFNTYEYVYETIEVTDEDSQSFILITYEDSESITFVNENVQNIAFATKATCIGRGVLFSLNNDNSLILRSEYVYDNDNYLIQIILKPYQVWRSPLSTETSAEFGVDNSLSDSNVDVIIRFADCDISLSDLWFEDRAAAA